jgi:hypothetical protein
MALTQEPRRMASKGRFFSLSLYFSISPPLLYLAMGALSFYCLALDIYTWYCGLYQITASVGE